MRRLFISIVFVLLPILLHAQPRAVNHTATATFETDEMKAKRIMSKAKTGKPYDVTRNFLGGDNLFSYVGQELYVVPPHNALPNLAKLTNDQGGYFGFLPPDTEEFMSYTTLHWNAYVSGMGHSATDAKYLSGRIFVVDKIRQAEESPSEFVFFMHDKKTGEQVNFLYSISARQYHDIHPNWGESEFPFITLSHFKHLQKKYIGKPLVVAAKSYSTRDDGWHRLAAVDVNTKDSIHFPDADYYIFKVEDIVLDEEFHQLCFQLTDGKHSFLSPLEMTYNEPSYSSYAYRKFLKSDWDALVAKYGLADMEAVLCTEITETMNHDLIRMTLGQGVTYEYKGLYYIMFCSVDQTVVFDKNWNPKGVVVGQCEQIRDVVLYTVFAGVVTFRTVNTVGRIIKAPRKIVKKFVDFFGI